jgi:hypothetical protein
LINTSQGSGKGALRCVLIQVLIALARSGAISRSFHVAKQLGKRLADASA